ncbi:hypothetical protein AOQ84DRAFT_382197 [Glonium stellatum]|uniref:Uncharacterized protein n=1 Tax=Glonium stellatum TaxID=574774 RepID=A0A8E2EQ83_9PEZI|nr:hypothetical protein AOQ84DRAFT_382197 [Glonium stellatum]
MSKASLGITGATAGIITTTLHIPTSMMKGLLAPRQATASGVSDLSPSFLELLEPPSNAIPSLKELLWAEFYEIHPGTTRTKMNTMNLSQHQFTISQDQFMISQDQFVISQAPQASQLIERLERRRHPLELKRRRIDQRRSHLIRAALTTSQGKILTACPAIRRKAEACCVFGMWLPSDYLNEFAWKKRNSRQCSRTMSEKNTKCIVDGGLKAVGRLLNEEINQLQEAVAKSKFIQLGFYNILTLTDTACDIVSASEGFPSLRTQENENQVKQKTPIKKRARDEDNICINGKLTRRFTDSTKLKSILLDSVEKGEREPTILDTPTPANRRSKKTRNYE